MRNLRGEVAHGYLVEGSAGVEGEAPVVGWQRQGEWQTENQALAALVFLFRASVPMIESSWNTSLSTISWISNGWAYVAFAIGFFGVYVALALVLLVGSGLLVRSFQNLTLIIPRVASVLGQSAPTTHVASAGSDGWTSTFQATSGSGWKLSPNPSAMRLPKVRAPISLMKSVNIAD